MADVKFSELTTLAAAQVATDDIFAVVDTSTTTSKKLTVANLLGQVPSGAPLHINDTTDSSSNITGAISTDGGLGVKLTSQFGGLMTVETGIVPNASDGAYLGTSSLEFSDLFLADAAVISLGDGGADVTLTHVADTGVLLNSTNQIQFGDSASYIAQSSDGVLRIDGEATVDINASTAVLISNDLKLDNDAAVLGFGVDNDVTLTHYADNGVLVNSTRKVYFEDGSNYDQYIGSAGSGITAIAAPAEIDLTATAIDINGTVDMSGLVTVQTGIVPNEQDGAYLGTSSLQFSDLFLADAAVIAFGDNGDVTLTHVADTGLLLSDDSGVGTTQLQFGDSGTYVAQSADGALDLVSDGSVNVTAGAAGLLVKGTTPKLTIGDAGAEDTFIVFDGNAQDYRIGLDDGTDKIEWGIGAVHGTTTAMTLGVNASVPVVQTTSAFAMAGTSGTFVTLGATDTSPSVKDGNLFKTHASTQTLVDFDDGVAGQQICVISTAAVTYDASATELKCGSTDIVTASGDVTWWTYDGTYWYLFGFLDQSDDLSTGWSG